MFTPQRKVWSGWSFTPGKKADGSGSDPNSNGVAVGKGKGAAFAEPLTPNCKDVGSEDQEEELREKVLRLENELFEYQYNLGLLLIEKKEWTSKYEELNEALIEAKDALKQEQEAHLIAINDVEKREEILRKALGVRSSLEQALRDIRSENAEIKFTADAKLSEANAVIASVEEKSLEVEAKLRADDAKLAEISRKNSEIERKLQELESRENELRRERQSFISEREAHETTLSKQREDLREWEKKLQDAEERLAKGQTYVYQREERANENDTHKTLKEKEDDINNRLTKLTLKEKELLIIEEKLNAREKTEIQKLLDEHNAILDETKRAFELEIDGKRKSLDLELKTKVTDVEKKEVEVKHMEEKISKREQALDKKLEKFKAKEKEFELKVKSLKEREQVIRSEEKNLEIKKKHMDADKEELLNLKAETEKLRIANEEQLSKMHEEKDRLRVSEEERAEWKKLEIEKELKNINLQKEKFEKEKLAEDEASHRGLYKRELEALEVAKETFAATMEHERSVVAEKAEINLRVICRIDLRRWRRIRREKKERDGRVETKRLKIEKERQEVNASKSHLEGQQIEIRKDIDDLVDLSKKLKDQREQLIKERNRFISFLEKQKSCKICGEIPLIWQITIPAEIFGNFVASERQMMSASVASGSPISAGTMSWLRMSTTEHEPELTSVVATESLEIHRFQSDTSTRDVEAGQDLSVIIRTTWIVRNWSNCDLKHGKQVHRRSRPRAKVRRSAKAVVNDAEAILGKALEPNELEHQNGSADSVHANALSRGESGLADGVTSRNERKRNHAQTSQISDILQQAREERGIKSCLAIPTGQKRYNLRRPKNGVTVGKTTSDMNRETEGAKDAVDQVDYSPMPASGTGDASENGGAHFLQQGETGPDTKDGNAGATKTFDANMALSEEVNGTPQGVGEYGDGNDYQSESHSEGHKDEDEDENDEEERIIWSTLVKYR
ncbi:hypothetical protein CXB51_027797 [Gossypium anomalum]|uniref:Nuclear matrix constituent protein 1-like protein n=1 Tax=Gossypium anomalum TaxID=47600 RepID=A0A8J5YBQ1_9ROSI|nr:hypothetical protein CXB51_027797 [Gossypium anomalum]